MLKATKSILILTCCLVTSITGYSQNLDLVEGFYEVLEKKEKNSRKMLLRGDSSLVYYIAEQPIVTKHDRLDSDVDQDTKTLYFFFDEHGTKKLLDFTTEKLGGKLGFVYVGSLRKIYTIEEVIDNGVIEFTAQDLYKVNRKPPLRAQ